MFEFASTLLLIPVSGQFLDASGQVRSLDANDSWDTYRDPMCDVDHGCQGDDNECWYKLSLMRTRPNGTIKDVEVGQNKVGFPTVDLHKVPCGGLRGQGEFVTVDGPTVYEGKDQVPEYFWNMWVTAKDQFDSNFRNLVKNLDYSNLTEHDFNLQIINSLTAAVGMYLGGQEDDTMNKIWMVKTKPTQADPDKSWDSSASSDDPRSNPIPIDQVPQDGKGVYRPCGQSYDLKQSQCPYKPDGQWPTSDPNGWEGHWMAASWVPEEASNGAFPFTGRGWTFDWYGYKEYLASGCSKSPKLMVGPSEMVVAYGTSFDLQNDGKSIYPLEHACDICFPLRCGAGFHTFANKSNMCK